MRSVAESSYAQHLAWSQQTKILEGSRALYEDETLSHILDTAITYDCLCVPNLACFELLVRRKQLLAEAHILQERRKLEEAKGRKVAKGFRKRGSGGGDWLKHCSPGPFAAGGSVST